MAPATLFEGCCWIVRPLLGQRRAALRTRLTEAGVSWIDDPSNVAETSERARLRARMDASQVEALLALGRDAARQRFASGAAVAQTVRDHVACVLPGLLRISACALQAQEPEPAIYALRILLATVGGTEQLPDAERVAEMLRSLRLETRLRVTLSRCVVDLRRAELYLYRELRGIPELTAIEAGSENRWDGRYRLTATHRLDRFAVASALAESAAVTTAIGAGRDLPASPARDATAARPWLRERDADPLQAVQPELLTQELAARHGLSVTPVVAPWARFLPVFDLDCARAVAELIGAAAIPASPWHGHIVTRA